MGENFQSDIIVIGGGLAGICAALAASRQGASVCLITDRPVLGGNSSSEIRVWTMGATCGGSLYSEEFGILGELKLRNLYTNPEFNVLYWDEVLLDTVLAEKNISLFLNTHITKIICSEKNEIESVQGYQLAAERELIFSGKYFIDATGDGAIGTPAGVPFFMGQESKKEYGENSAPDSSTSHTLGNTIFFISKKCDKPIKFVPPAYIHPIEIIEKYISSGGRKVNEYMNGCDYWWFEYGGTRDTIKDNQDISLELRRVALGIWNYIKNSGNFDANNLTLEWIGTLPGKRESRRFIGSYVLTENDIINHKCFNDTIAYGGWYLDLHPPGGIFSPGEKDCIQIPIEVYNIPFRCLFNPDFPNLLFAGRDISVSHAAFASTRVMNTCALTGDAAGIGAVYALQSNCPPPRMQERDYHKIQQMLMSEGNFLPGFTRDKKSNLAREASISVSSVFSEFEERGLSDGTYGSLVLNNKWYLLVTKKAETSFCEVMTRSSDNKKISVRIEKQNLPCRLLEDSAAQKIKLDIALGTSWTKINFPSSWADYEGFILFSGEAVDGLSIVTEPVQTTGFLAGYRDSISYWYPQIKSDIKGLYGSENLNDGMIRPYRIPGSWISGNEKEPSILFEWNSNRILHEVIIYFNPDFSLDIPSCITGSPEARSCRRKGMPPELVKDYRIEFRQSDGWKEAIRVKDNWNYKSICRFQEGIHSSAIKIIIESTYGSPRAEVFEIEIY